jgi:DNA-binding IclR family transcriptional regulator
LEVLAAYPDGCNITTLREALGVNGVRMNRVLESLIEQKLVGTTERRHDRRTEVIYRCMFVTDLSATAIQARRVSLRDQKVYEIRSGHSVRTLI